MGEFGTHRIDSFHSLPGQSRKHTKPVIPVCVDVYGCDLMRIPGEVEGEPAVSRTRIENSQGSGSMARNHVFSEEFIRQGAQLPDLAMSS